MTSLTANPQQFCIILHIFLIVWTLFHGIFSSNDFIIHSPSHEVQLTAEWEERERRLRQFIILIKCRWPWSNDIEDSGDKKSGPMTIKLKPNKSNKNRYLTTKKKNAQICFHEQVIFFLRKMSAFYNICLFNIWFSFVNVAAWKSRKWRRWIELQIRWFKCARRRWWIRNLSCCKREHCKQIHSEKIQHARLMH